MEPVITIVTSGTQGDVRPMVALGRGLHQYGYRVRVLTHKVFRQFVSEHGLDFVVLDGNPGELFSQPAFRTALTYRGGLFQSIHSALAYLRAARPLFARMLSSAWQGCQGSNALIISLPTTWGDQIADALGIPCIWALTQPLGRTSAFPSPLQPFRLTLGPMYNNLTHMLAEHIVWQPWRDLLDDWRQHTLKLSPLRSIDWISRTAERGDLWLFGYSPSVVARPADWPERFHVTGYWLLDQVGWQPAPELLDFLLIGPPPLYVGFGGATAVVDEQFQAQVLGGLARSGQRAIVSLGDGCRNTSLPSSLYSLDFAPHDWLFPQLRAAIHHGGAGTVAAALRAGIPSICVPFGADQFFWSSRVAQLNAGLTPLPARRLTAERLATAIDSTIRQSHLSQHAARIGQQIRNEQGVEHGVALIDQHIKRAVHT